MGASRFIVFLVLSITCSTSTAGTGILGGSVCDPAIAGGSTSISSHAEGTCAGCVAVAEGLAIDGDPLTGALMNIAAAVNGGLALRATAQSGIVYPGGNEAAAVVTAPVYVHLDRRVKIRTYLSGALQEDSGLLASAGVQVGSQPGHVRSDFRFATSGAFDAVEVFISSSASAETLVSAFEFCGGTK